MAKRKVKTVAEQILSKMKTPVSTHVELHGEYLEGVSVDVLRTIPFDDAMQASVDLANSCMDMEEAEYYPEAFDAALGTLILIYYAGMEMPDDATLSYRIVFETDILDQIIPHINMVQLDSIKEAAVKRIEYDCRLLSGMAGSKTMELMTKFDRVIYGQNEMIESMGKVDFSGAMEKMSQIIMDEHRPIAEGKTLPFARPKQDEEE